MSTVHAVFQNGAFYPIEPVGLPENCEVEFEPRVVESTSERASLDDIYEILNQRFETGQADLAARHNEHHP